MVFSVGAVITCHGLTNPPGTCLAYHCALHILYTHTPLTKAAWPHLTSAVDQGCIWGTQGSGGWLPLWPTMSAACLCSKQWPARMCCCIFTSLTATSNL